ADWRHPQAADVERRAGLVHDPPNGRVTLQRDRLPRSRERLELWIVLLEPRPQRLVVHERIAERGLPAPQELDVDDVRGRGLVDRAGVGDRPRLQELL